MRRNVELACAWAGMVFAVLFFVGFLIAGFIPPLSPDDSAQEIAATYQEDKDSIRAGLLVAFAGCIAYLAFGAGISGQTRRISGCPPGLLHLQIAAYSASVLLILLPITMWFTCAFRPDEYSPEVIQIVNDLGWISFLIGYVPFVTWYVATGASILCDDDSESPVFPRWSGYFSVFMGMAQTTSMLLVYFKTGPWAWDGLFAWWLPATWFFLWFVVMTILTTKAINNPYRELSETPRVPPAVPPTAAPAAAEI